MLGAYTTYAVQTLFHELPARRASTATCSRRSRSRSWSRALVGMLLERSVIRHLYGRPLETLLATWGISLMLIQTVRLIFGAQNVSGRQPRRGSRAASRSRTGSCCPTAASRSSSSSIAGRRRSCGSSCSERALGLQVRAVTQNRAHGGVPGRVHRARRHVDLRPRLGHRGARRRGAVAARQRRARARAELHRRLVHGRRARRRRRWPARSRRRWASASSTSCSSRSAGAVLGKIVVLVLIILFIQRRPQGMFALKGRVGGMSMSDAAPARDALAARVAVGRRALARAARGADPAAQRAAAPTRRCTCPTTWCRCSGKFLCFAHGGAGDGSGLGLRRHPEPGPRRCSSRSAATPWACT